MNLPAAVFSDGARLFVADAENNRVLVWSNLPTSNGQAADFALGQPSGAANLTSTTANNGGLAGSSMNAPGSVYSDGTHLFVVDQLNNRVLVWTTMPTTGGQAADFALGQPAGAGNLTANTANNGGVSGASLRSPNGVMYDGTHLFVADQANNRVLQWSALPTTGGQPADFALGQPAGAGNLTLSGSGVSGTSMFSPRNALSDGTHLFVVDSGNNRVLVWSNLPADRPPTSRSASPQAPPT